VMFKLLVRPAISPAQVPPSDRFNPSLIHEKTNNHNRTWFRSSTA